MTLEEKLTQLRLLTMAQKLKTMTHEAAKENLSFAAALERLADQELEARHGRAIERRFRLSRLPAQPTLDQFHFAQHKSRQQEHYEASPLRITVARGKKPPPFLQIEESGMLSFL
jgi:DNA replication protein DnaC